MSFQLTVTAEDWSAVGASPAHGFLEIGLLHPVLGDTITTDKTWEARLLTDGTASWEIPTIPADNALKVRSRVAGLYSGKTFYFSDPGVGPHTLTELIEDWQVDPTTLQPTPDVAAAWDVALAGSVKKALNLDDLPDKAAARTNLGVLSSAASAAQHRIALGNGDAVLKTAAGRPTTAATITNSGNTATVTGRTIAKDSTALTFNGPTGLSGDGNWVIAQQPRLPDGAYSSDLGDAMLGVEFVFDGQAFEFLTLGFGGTHLITVDGALVSGTPGGVGNSFDNTYMKVNLGSRGRRRIGLWLAYGWFGGLRLAATDSVWGIGADATPTIAFLGDSYPCYGPTSEFVAHNYNTYAQQLGRLLGFRAVTNFCASGTGYVASNGTSFAGPYSTRVADLIAYQPDIAIIQGSLNDYQADLTTYEAAVQALLTTVRDGLPNARIIATGILDARDNASQSTDAAQNAIIQSAAASLGIPYVDPTGWFFGTGTIASPAGDGNRDLYTYSDGVHPYAPAGADYLASRLYDPVRALLA